MVLSQWSSPVEKHTANHYRGAWAFTVQLHLYTLEGERITARERIHLQELSLGAYSEILTTPAQLPILTSSLVRKRLAPGERRPVVRRSERIPAFSLLPNTH